MTDPLVLTILVSGGLLICGFIIGFNYKMRIGSQLVEAAIGSTIDNLIREGYIATDVNEDGDTILLKVSDVVGKAVADARKV